MKAVKRRYIPQPNCVNGSDSIIQWNAITRCRRAQLRHDSQKKVYRLQQSRNMRVGLGYASFAISPCFSVYPFLGLPLGQETPNKMQSPREKHGPWRLNQARSSLQPGESLPIINLLSSRVHTMTIRYPCHRLTSLPLRTQTRKDSRQGYFDCSIVLKRKVSIM
jgi:hypothetical protein